MKAHWERAHLNPNSGHLVLSVTTNTQEGHNYFPATLHSVCSQQERPAASRGKGREKAHKEQCFQIVQPGHFIIFYSTDIHIMKLCCFYD